MLARHCVFDRIKVPDIPTSESIDDAEAYTHMTDSIIMEIERSRDPGQRIAQSLLLASLSFAQRCLAPHLTHSTSRVAGNLEETPPA